MARLINAEKMGFFATPPSVTARIAAWLRAPAAQPWRLLDPCCGAGVAAAQIAAAVGGDVSTWGVELNPQRAAQAAQVLDKVYPTAWQSTRVSREAISLLWLNPPYDYDLDSANQRLEAEFLRCTYPALTYGGILVFIIPHRLLGHTDVARTLAGHFEHLAVRRFPDGEYARFKQVVVFARRKRYATPTHETLDLLLALRHADLSPLADPPANWDPALPPAPPRARFYRASLSRRERVALAAAHPWPPDLLTALEPALGMDIAPPMPLKKGHVAMLMSSGLMGCLLLTRDGTPQLVKGRVLKTQDVHTVENDQGETVTTAKDRFVTQVGVVRPDGADVIEDVAGLTAFMEGYGDELAAEILKHPPRYNLKPTAAEWQHMNTLGQERPALPGQQPGLLPVQKHVAIALTRTLRANPHVILQGEMGLGKTTMGLAVIDALDAYPALIIAPPQLVGKWAREARAVIPGVQVRELRRLGYDAEAGHDVNDARQFAEDWRAGRLGHKAIAVIAETSAKLGSGWAGATATRYTLPQPAQDRAPFKAACRAYREAREDLRRLRRAGRDPAALATAREQTARLRQRALAAALPIPVCPDCGRVQVNRKGAVIQRPKPFDRTPRTCPCPIPGWQRDAAGARLLDDAGQPHWAALERRSPNQPLWWGVDGDAAANRAAPTCAGRLYQFGSRYRRWPLASYIRRRLPGLFQMLVADEVHQYRGKSSDRGHAFHHLITATRYHLGLTGTLYGGRSTSVFYLFYRLLPQVRAGFDYGAENAWIAQYGVRQTVTRARKYPGTEDAYGSYNATARRRTQSREMPGVSPAIMGQIVDGAVFLALKDLGVALPAYHEDVVTLKMTPEQAAQYRRMESTLRAKARRSPRWLSTWLQWSLGRPNAAFRDAVVTKDERDEDGNVIATTEVLELPAIVAGTTPHANADGTRVAQPNGDDPLPKEAWLADFCRAERAAGRRVLVYARQTATRDIQPRLQAVLEAAGLRATTLYNNVATRQREAWIARRAPQLDALICNPKLVQTGLDLVQFASVVFYEIDYDLFVMWQAMRRVWRLGQPLPVKVVFTVYAHTMEERALRLLGRKMKAAQLLYGDEIGGAIVPEDDANFLTELARSVLEDQPLPDLVTLFAAAQASTASALGSPTAVSPRLPALSAADVRRLWEDLRAQAARKAEQRAARQQQRRAQQLTQAGVQAQQLGMFGGAP